MRKINLVISLCFTFLYMQSLCAAEMNSPIGYWKTIDDVTGQTKSILQVKESSNHLLVGEVVKLFRDAAQICTQCVGPKKNQPILGMIVMEGLKQNHDNANLWANGSILDPKNGKTYHCNIQVIDHGQKLQVRGYIGLPLFGRTQTWIRASGPQSS